MKTELIRVIVLDWFEMASYVRRVLWLVASLYPPIIITGHDLYEWPLMSLFLVVEMYLWYRSIKTRFSNLLKEKAWFIYPQLQVFCTVILCINCIELVGWPLQLDCCCGKYGLLLTSIYIIVYEPYKLNVCWLHDQCTSPFSLSQNAIQATTSTLRGKVRCCPTIFKVMIWILFLGKHVTCYYVYVCGR
jgi:hypothetical protein